LSKSAIAVSFRCEFYYKKAKPAITESMRLTFPALCTFYCGKTWMWIVCFQETWHMVDYMHAVNGLLSVSCCWHGVVGWSSAGFYVNVQANELLIEIMLFLLFIRTCL